MFTFHHSWYIYRYMLLDINSDIFEDIVWTKNNFLDINLFSMSTWVVHKNVTSWRKCRFAWVTDIYFFSVTFCSFFIKRMYVSTWYSTSLGRLYSKCLKFMTFNVVLILCTTYNFGGSLYAKKAVKAALSTTIQ